MENEEQSEIFKMINEEELPIAFKLLKDKPGKYFSGKSKNLKVSMSFYNSRLCDLTNHYKPISKIISLDLLKEDE